MIASQYALVASDIDTNVGDSGFVISAIRILDERDIVTTYVLPCICMGDAPRIP